MYNFDGLYHNVICNVILIIVVLLFAGISLNNYNAYSARTAHPFQRNGAPFRFKLSKAQQVD